LIITALSSNFLTYTPGSGSGGSATVGSFAGYADAAANWSSIMVAGRLIKDVGKTVVSSGRTFKKFQAVLGTATNSSPTFGVAGKAATSTDTGYLTGYLEVGTEGASAAPAPIARYS
jgi:hypothetical protein